MAEISFHQINESELSSLAFSAGQFIVCKDTGNAYVDNNDGDRVSVAKYVISLATDTNRTELLTPLENVIYCVKATGKMWIYTGGAWKQVGGSLSGTIKATLSVASWSSKTYTISNSIITSTSSVQIIWDKSIEDIADGCSISVSSIANGSFVLTATTVPIYDLYAIFYIS